MREGYCVCVGGRGRERERERVFAAVASASAADAASAAFVAMFSDGMVVRKKLKEREIETDRLTDRV